MKRIKIENCTYNTFFIRYFYYSKKIGIFQYSVLNNLKKKPTHKIYIIHNKITLHYYHIPYVIMCVLNIVISNFI